MPSVPAALSGLDPNDPDTIYLYRALTKTAQQTDFWTGERPTNQLAFVYDVFVNAQIWYTRRMTAILSDFKAATDVFGGNLLDQTIVPYVTETADPTSWSQGLPALIFGGRALGMQGGQFQQRTGSLNALWATIAQAYFETDDPLATPALQSEVFNKTNVAPIPGLWVKPT